jgi:uncharacterized protein involved in exopolysaccharide biosynthesis
MATPNIVLSTLRKYLGALYHQAWLWMTVTIACTLAAAAYAMVRPAEWSASQALVVRDEAVGNLNSRGRFDSSESMRAFQEMILEIARSRVAVRAAMKTVGPPEDHDLTRPWPSEEDIEALQRRIAVSAPKGAEFGSTEVVYLSVVGPSRQQAIERTVAVCDQLEQRLADLRNAKAASVLAELEENLSLARADQETATAHLESMEREVGSDLGELRILNDYGSGDSNLRAALNQVQTEMRQVTSAHEANLQLEQLLVSARDDANQLLATPARLLESQPTLGRLRDGLVDSQLRTSELRGRMRDDHPLVVAASRAEAEVRQNIADELGVALRAVAADLHVSQQQLESLQQQHDELQTRLSRLAGLRARYSNLVDDVSQRTEIVNQAKQNLAEAKASQSAAQSSSLLTRFNAPVAGENPLGPSRSQIVAGGFAGGLMIGVGLVFLSVPTTSTRGRRWSDLLSFGRRVSDRCASPPVAASGDAGGRRAEDRVLANRPATFRAPLQQASDFAATRDPS